MLVNQLPRESALMRDIHGLDAEWGLQEQLQAAMIDAVHLLLWQNSGGKGRRPQPVPRPGVDDGKDRKTLGNTVIPSEELSGRLAELRRNAEVSDGS